MLVPFFTGAEQAGRGNYAHRDSRLPARLARNLPTCANLYQIKPLVHSWSALYFL